MGGSGALVALVALVALIAPPVRFCACPCVWLCGDGRCVVVDRAAGWRAAVVRCVVVGRCVAGWGCGLLAWVGGRFVGRWDVDIAGFSIGSVGAGQALVGVVVSRACHADASIRLLSGGGTYATRIYSIRSNGRCADACGLVHLSWVGILTSLTWRGGAERGARRVGGWGVCSGGEVMSGRDSRNHPSGQICHMAERNMATWQV